ncbi:MAG: GIY-YIG nuclease family protein, partial [Melioribacteraceae bacterium]
DTLSVLYKSSRLARGAGGAKAGRISPPRQKMDTFTTYILFSKSSGKYYVGHTNNISRRFEEHNSGQNISTKSGAPWDLIFTQPFSSNSDACAKNLLSDN